jgi:hypothetical protein
MWSRLKLWWYDIKYYYNDDCFVHIANNHSQDIKLTFKK